MFLLLLSQNAECMNEHMCEPIYEWANEGRWGRTRRVTFSNLFIIAPPAAENEKPAKGRQEQ